MNEETDTTVPPVSSDTTIASARGANAEMRASYLRATAQANGDRPLWMPRGSVRSILALGIVGAAIASHLTGNGAGALDGLAGAVSYWYFEHRSEK